MPAPCGRVGRVHKGARANDIPATQKKTLHRLVIWRVTEKTARNGAGVDEDAAKIGGGTLRPKFRPSRKSYGFQSQTHIRAHSAGDSGNTRIFGRERGNINRKPIRGSDLALPKINRALFSI
jgi:hypothetical protein